jgi:hypothetical protein
MHGNGAVTLLFQVVVSLGFGARFAVFVRRARVLLSPCYATRNLS